MAGAFVAVLLSLVLPWTASPATAAGASGPVVFPGDPHPVQIPDSLSGTLVDVAPDGSTKLANSAKVGPAGSLLTVLAMVPSLINAGCWVSGRVMSSFGTDTDCEQGANELGLGFLVDPFGDAPEVTATHRWYNADGTWSSSGSLNPAEYAPADLAVSIKASAGTNPTASSGVLATCLRPDGSTVTAWSYIAPGPTSNGATSNFVGCANPTAPLMANTSTVQLNGHPAPPANGDFFVSMNLCAVADGCKLVTAAFWVGIRPSGTPAAGTLRGIWQSPHYAPRTITYTATCSNGTTTNTQVVTVTWNATAGAASPSPQMTPCEQAFPGSRLTNMTGSYGPTGAPPTASFSQPVFTSSALTSYPLCTTKAPTGGCWLDLKTPAGQSCFAKNVYCAGWSSDTTGWKCSWGPYNMAISMCLAEYGTSFDTQPAPAPGATPGVYPGWDPTPNPNPSGTPTPTPNPTPSAPTVPTSPGGNGCEVGSDCTPLSQTDCHTATWSSTANPFALVFDAIKNGLRAVFVPCQLEGWTGLVEQVKARPPLSVALALGAEVQAIGDGFSGAGTCGVLADFGDGMEISCAAIRAIPGYNALQALISVALVGLTGITCFHILRGVLGSEGGD